MNLAQVIHQRWVAAAGLNALLPAGRVYTGSSVDPTPPFAILSKLTGRPAARFNDGSACDTVAVRIEVYDSDYDHALAVREQVKLAFDGASFALAGSDRVLDMRRTDDAQQQRPDGVWLLAMEFECYVYVE